MITYDQGFVKCKNKKDIKKPGSHARYTATGQGSRKSIQAKPSLYFDHDGLLTIKLYYNIFTIGFRIDANEKLSILSPPLISIEICNYDSL